MLALAAAAAALLPAQPAPKSPLVVLLGGDVKLWQGWTQAAGWRFLAPWEGATEPNLDLRIKSLETKLAEFIKQSPVDEERVYLAAQNEAVPALFYTVSRLAYPWAAAVALGGIPRPAMDSNRLYAANTTLVPVLWLFGEQALEPLAQRLKTAGYNLEWKVGPSANPTEVLGWLETHRRDEFPPAIDCETGVPAFSRCYWIEVTKFDPAQRNDVLDSTRVQPVGSGAVLELGPFAWDPSAPGPGVLVARLPENYKGPLKAGDRIVAIGGKPLADAKAFTELLDRTTEEKPAVVMVQRGRERERIETRFIVPPRAEPVTARVKALYLPDLKEIQVVSRGIASMRLSIPEAWAPAALNWNGTALAADAAAGCWLFEERNHLLSAKRCP